MSYVMCILNITVSWDVTPYIVVNNLRHFGRNLLPSSSETGSRSSETHVNFQATSITFKDPNFRAVYPK